MTRRERLENKLAKRLEWAEKAEQRSTQAFERVDQIASMIPMGQPILVGHHSEAHARADQRRIENGMSKGVAEAKLAEHHAQAASGLARALEHNIFSDDDDAITALEQRIAEREVKAAHMVAMNKAWRQSKGDAPTFARLAGVSVEAAERVAANIAKAYSWEKQPYPSWELSNLRNNIRSDKQRIEDIKARTARSEKAESAGGVLIEGDDYVRVTFSEKPDRSIINALKTAGFRWSGGHWHGFRANLPELS